MVGASSGFTRNLLPNKHEVEAINDGGLRRDETIAFELGLGFGIRVEAIAAIFRGGFQFLSESSAALSSCCQRS